MISTARSPLHPTLLCSGCVSGLTLAVERQLQMPDWSAVLIAWFLNTSLITYIFHSSCRVVSMLLFRVSIRDICCCFGSAYTNYLSHRTLSTTVSTRCFIRIAILARCLIGYEYCAKSLRKKPKTPRHHSNRRQSSTRGVIGPSKKCIPDAFSERKPICLRYGLRRHDQQSP